MSTTAYRKDYATSINAAIMTAGDVTAALVNHGFIASLDDAAAVAKKITAALFEVAKPIVDEDNAAFEAAAERDGETSSRSSSRGGSGRSLSGRGKGGRSRSGGKSGGFKKPTLKSASELELTWGAFEGVTLGDLVGISAEDADADFGYGDGERDGSDYLVWLASENNPNEFVRERAILVAEDAGLELDN